jgi:hypothetical protein
MTKEDPKDQRQQKHSQDNREHKHSQVKRKHKRYNINSGAFVLLKSEEVEILGSIKDISSGGLSMSHIDENKELNGSDKISVNLISENTCCDLFSSRTIWNSVEDGGFMAAMVKMRRRGVKFEHLNPDKEIELKKFIDALIEK